MNKRILIIGILGFFLFSSMSFASTTFSYFFDMIGSDGRSYQIEVIDGAGPGSSRIIVHDGAINYTGSGYVGYSRCMGGDDVDTDYVRITISKNGNTVSFYSNDCIDMNP